MYKLQKDRFGEISSVFRLDGWSIPFSPDNTDYQQFLKDIKEGVELLDAEGVIMADAKAYVASLP